ncbi:Coproporphyrinogen III oxidase [Scenedesmus sp. NREL 46B-D3]|nr:Coproporphyrinogen III oxidase [Scenedesmus sp. NREL 46B-D3]
MGEAQRYRLWRHMRAGRRQPVGEGSSKHQHHPGTLSAARAQAMSSRGRSQIDPAGGQPYSAAALSLVFHAAHPLVPTLRADVRLFQVAGCSWFGGGCDLTPSYLFEQDAAEFHAYWQGVCDKYSPELYAEHKAWCDKYFYIPARKEHRGIGGLFFDDLDAEGAAFDVQAYTEDVARGILPSWTAIAQRRSSQQFTEEQRNWQLLRRGRYLEFNLLYDRGVKFGLDGGRVESIMVSAPPLIAWKYNVVPKEGSEEEKLVKVLQQPREWV